MYLCTSKWYALRENNDNMSVLQITSREFKDNLSAYFDCEDSGKEAITGREKQKSYVLVSVETDDFALSPELEWKIEESREQYRQGKFIRCSTAKKLDLYLDSL